MFFKYVPLLIYVSLCVFSSTQAFSKDDGNRGQISILDIFFRYKQIGPN